MEKAIIILSVLLVLDLIGLCIYIQHYAKKMKKERDLCFRYLAEVAEMHTNIKRLRRTHDSGLAVREGIMLKKLDQIESYVRAHSDEEGEV